MTRSAWTAEERAEYRRETVELLHAQLAEQVSKLDSIDAWQQWLTVARSLHAYSFSNVLLIVAQRPDATLVAGFSTWKQLGHSVRRGEKAIRILAPVLVKMPLLDDAGNPVLDDDGRTRHRRQMVGVKPVSVFDVSQVTPPVETPPRPRLLDGAAPPGLWTSLVELAEVEGYSVSRGDCGTANGLVRYETREIRVRADVDELQAAKSLLHELGHVLTMTPDEFGSYEAQREVREVEAESVAFTVLGAHGVDTSRYSFDYVAGWAARAATADRSVRDVIMATGQRVITAADRILTHTQHLLTPEDALADQWANSVQVAPTISPASRAWETVSNPGSRPRHAAQHLGSRPASVGVPR